MAVDVFFASTVFVEALLVQILVTIRPLTHWCVRRSSDLNSSSRCRTCWIYTRSSTLREVNSGSHSVCRIPTKCGRTALAYPHCAIGYRRSFPGYCPHLLSALSRHTEARILRPISSGIAVETAKIYAELVASGSCTREKFPSPDEMHVRIEVLMGEPEIGMSQIVLRNRVRTLGEQSRASHFICTV